MTATLHDQTYKGSETFGCDRRLFVPALEPACALHGVAACLPTVRILYVCIVCGSSIFDSAALSLRQVV